MATRASIFGAPWKRDRKPEVKKARLIAMTIKDRIISVRARPRWLWSRKAGTGRSSMLWPMVMYIRNTRKMMERMSRRFNFGVSWSFSASSSAARAEVSSADAFMGFAPYPAFSTAETTSFAGTSPSTDMEFVSRDTVTCFTPGTLDTAFSTWAWQAAQVIPDTIYWHFSAIKSPTFG